MSDPGRVEARKDDAAGDGVNPGLVGTGDRQFPGGREGGGVDSSLQMCLLARPSDVVEGCSGCTEEYRSYEAKDEGDRA
nr:hypothetical protein [Methylobacterium isbiliense]